jgi:hypothetical protein
MGSSVDFGDFIFFVMRGRSRDRLRFPGVAVAGQLAERLLFNHGSFDP